VLEFALAAVLLSVLNLRLRSSFVRWYAPGLGFIGLGLSLTLFVHDMGVALAWAGRTGQAAGTLCVLVALWQRCRESHVWEIPLQVRLDESERRFRVLAEASFEGIVLSREGCIVDCNEQALRILGRERDELRGRALAGLLPVDQRDGVVAAIRQGEELITESEVRRPDGGLVALEIHGRTVTEAGRPLRLSVLRDVTARRTAEQALRRSEEHFRGTFDNAAVGMSQVDLDGRFLRVNDRLCQISGYPREELVGQTLQVLAYPEDVETERAHAAQLRAGDTASYEVQRRYRRRDGTPVWTYLTGSLQRDDEGRPGFYILVVEDITHRKRVEQELQDLNDTLEERVRERTARIERLAGQLRAQAAEMGRVEQRERRRLSLVLHDHIQQLLVAARIQLEQVRRHPDWPTARPALEQADTIVQEAIEATRTLSIDLCPPVLHESGLAAGIGWLARHMGETSRFQVDVKLEGDAEPEVEETRFLLFECVRELLLNALKHSGVRQARVTLERTPSGCIQVVVADEGCGFDPALLGRRSSDGATFGLFSIQQRLEHCGGSLCQDSAPGRGTRVTLTVPAGRRREAAVGPAGQAPCEEGGRPPRPLAGDARIAVMVVDDHEIVREGLVGLLRLEPDISVVAEAGETR
ncbi:MAG: PAS domain S-box protein, partial [Candidatus Latescibacterota bacterium]